MSDIGHNVGADELKQFVERVEHVQSEIDGLNSDKADIFKELRGRGFDAKAVRRIIAIRRRDHAEYQEEKAILELYAQALGVEL